MPGLKLRSEIKTGGTRLMTAATLQRIVFPYGRMQPLRHGAAHQRVIGRVIFDKVDAAALPVMRTQLRQFGVGKTSQILRLGRKYETARLLQFCMKLFWKTRRNLHEKRVAQISVRAGDRRRLVGDFVRFQGFVPFGLIQLTLSLLHCIC